MNCKDARAVIDQFFDRELDDESLARLHFEECADCHSVLTDYQAIRDRLSGLLPDIEVPSSLPTRIRSAVSRTLVDCSAEFDYIGSDESNNFTSKGREKLVCESSESVDDQLSEPSVTHELIREDIQEVMQLLTPIERDILSLRFGLNDGVVKAHEDVGKLLGLSRERVREIEATAFLKLRRSRQRGNVHKEPN